MTSGDSCQASRPMQPESRTGGSGPLRCSSQSSFSRFLLRQAPQRIIDQKHGAPLIAKSRTHLGVQLDRLLVPVEHLPVYSVTVLVDRNARDRSQQCDSNAALAECLPHKQVFQKQSATRPCRIVSQKNCVYCRTPSPLGDERAETRVLPEPISRQVFFADGDQFELTLKLREFSNHGLQQCCILDGCRTNLKHGRRTLLGR